MMDKLINKLNMLGFNTIKHNRFAVVYLQNKELRVIRYENRDGRQIKVEETDIDSYRINENFIKLGRFPAASVLYTAYGKVANEIALATCCYNKDDRMSQLGLFGDSKVITYEVDGDKMYLVNYQGKKIDITKYKRKDSLLETGILYDEKRDIYMVGHGKRWHPDKNSFCLFGVKEFLYTILEVDAEFNSINYITNVS